MVKLLAIINNFTNEIQGKLCMVNIGGRSTEQIGKVLIKLNIYSADNIHSDGFLYTWNIPGQDERPEVQMYQICQEH